MPTVDCGRTDCVHIGRYENICTAKRITQAERGCLTYEFNSKLMQVERATCHRATGGKWSVNHGRTVR